jgi:hypothetical protein
MSDLKFQRQAFRAAMNEHRQLVPGEDATRAKLGEASPTARTPWRDGILQPPKPQITHRRRSSRSPPNMTSNTRPDADRCPSRQADPDRRQATRQHELLSGLGQYRVDAGLIFGQPATPGRVGLPLALSLRLAHVPRAGLMVFKSTGDSLPGNVATWIFSGRARRGARDHPVYVPRAVRCPVRWMAAEHLFRRSMDVSGQCAGIRIRRSRSSRVSDADAPGSVPSNQSVRKP